MKICVLHQILHHFITLTYIKKKTLHHVYTVLRHCNIALTSIPEPAGAQMVSGVMGDSGTGSLFPVSSLLRNLHASFPHIACRWLGAWDSSVAINPHLRHNWSYFLLKGTFFVLAASQPPLPPTHLLYLCLLFTHVLLETSYQQLTWMQMVLPWSLRQFVCVYCGCIAACTTWSQLRGCMYAVSSWPGGDIHHSTGLVGCDQMTEQLSTILNAALT